MKHSLKMYPAQGMISDHPFDKKRPMPIAISAGIAAGSAIAAGAAVTAAGVAAIAAGTAVAVGLTMTVVGMATGDKSLMKIGGLVGLAGGLVGAGLNMAGFGAEAFQGMEAAAQATAESTAGLAGDVGSAITPAFESGATTGVNVVSKGAETGITKAASSALPTMGDITGTATSSASGSGIFGTSSLGASGSQALTKTIPAIAPTAEALGNTTNIVAGAANLSKGAAGASTLFDKLLESPTALALGGSALSGLYQANVGKQTNALTSQQQAFLQQQQAYQNANANAIPTYGLQATPITAEQQQAAALQRAQNAAQVATTITNTKVA